MQMGRKSKRISDDEMGKRQPYGFGLGRPVVVVVSVVVVVVVVVVENYYYILLHSEDEMGKRQSCGFGLGRPPDIWGYMYLFSRFLLVTPHLCNFCIL